MGTRGRLRGSGPITAPVCTHPPARLYSWRAWDGTWCVGCCVCGVVLAGAMTHADAQAVMQDDAVTP